MFTFSMISSLGRSSSSPRSLSVAIVAALAAIPAGPAFASIWTDWTSRATVGNQGGEGAGILRVDGVDVGVSYEGTGTPFRFGQDFISGNVFAADREHLISPLVQEAPGDSGDLDFVYFNFWSTNRRNNHITFTSPVTNPIIAFAGFGRGGAQTGDPLVAYTAWDFDQDFTILSSNTGSSYLAEPVAGTLVGNFGSGVIMFEGTYSGISWTYDSNSFDQQAAIQIGALGSAVPAPGAAALLGGAGLLGQRRRRR